MSKYLLKVSYTSEGAKGLAKDGGTKRRDAAAALVKSLGGTLESMHFAFGETDVYAICDLPDNLAAMAGSLALAGSGAVTSSIVVLLTAEEVDQAVKKTGSYTPPGR